MSQSDFSRPRLLASPSVAATFAMWSPSTGRPDGIGINMPRKPSKVSDKSAAGLPVKQLISVGAFWKNDKPGGIGFLIHIDEWGAQAMLHLRTDLVAMMNSYYQHPDPAFIPEYFKQLEGFAAARQQGVQMDSRSAVLIITNIAYLVEVGEIQSDEWNGVTFMYDV